VGAGESGKSGGKRFLTMKDVYLFMAERMAAKGLTSKTAFRRFVRELESLPEEAIFVEIAGWVVEVEFERRFPEAGKDPSKVEDAAIERFVEEGLGRPAVPGSGPIDMIIHRDPGAARN
jgi:hypothetical protein